MTPAENWKPGEEGVFLNLDSDLYHSAPGVSRSMLEHISPPLRLPHYLRRRNDPKVWAIIGTLVHAKILEPSKPLPFIELQPKEIWSEEDGKLVPWSGEDSRPKARAKWKKQRTDAGIIVLEQKDFDAVHGCVESLADNPDPDLRAFLRSVFTKGRSEVSIFKSVDAEIYRDAQGSTFQPLLRKCRIDWASKGEALVDIKTTLEFGADPDVFQRTLYETYLTQPPYYLDLWNETHPDDQKRCFVFVVVEKIEPFVVGVYGLDRDTQAITLGRMEYQRRLEEYGRCAARNHWPGYSAGVQMIDLPDYGVRALRKRFGLSE